jgi:ABC-2 type transport system ATP-binding protein
LIKVENLTKYYGKRLAVDNISFNVEQGEIVGFLGPNAAGKTTTMRMLTGFLTPTAGNAWIAGHSILTESLEARQRIGYFAESVPLYTDMTVRDYLTFLARLRGVSREKTEKRADAVIKMSGLEEYTHTLIGRLSRGFRQRVGIAQSIVHEPDVLIMDEPTVGIDPIQVATTRQLIKDLGKEHTILLSTHILPEVSITCERVIIINNGKIVAQDRIENLSSLVSGVRRVKLEVEGPSKKITEKLQQVKGITRVVYDGRTYLVEFPSGQDLRARITEAIVQGGWTLLSLETVEMSLEDIFLKLTTKEPNN